MYTVKIGSTHFPVRGLITLFGSGLFLISLAIDFTYGNLNTYIISYLRVDSPDTTYADWVYVSTVKPIVLGIFMTFSGEVSRRIGLRASLAIGGVIYCVGVVTTGLAVKSSIWAVMATLGICHGFALSFTYAQSIEVAMKWFPNDKGFMASIALCGYGFGGMIWNPIETAFVNPDNASPDEQDGDDLYFTDADLLSRVPKLFYLLGGIYAGLQIFALICIREPTLDEMKDIKEMSKGLKEKEEELSSAEEDTYSVHPKKTIRIREFYLMWIAFLALNTVNSFINSYAKPFAQRYIQDDQFLAAMATISSVANGFCRLVWGKVFDLQGYQFTLVMISSLAAFFSYSFVDLAAMEPNSNGAKGFYGFWLCALYSVFPGIFAAMAPGVMSTFGPKFYSSNYGLIHTTNIVFSILNLTLFKYLLDLPNGYFYMFFFIGSMSVVSAFASWIYPDKWDSEAYRERFSIARA